MERVEKPKETGRYGRFSFDRTKLRFADRLISRSGLALCDERWPSIPELRFAALLQTPFISLISPFLSQYAHPKFPVPGQVICEKRGKVAGSAG
jgi:hypothetical protein